MLFLGSFLKILVMCKTNSVNQKDIVTSCMKIIDSKFTDSEKGDICSKLAGGRKNPSIFVREEVKKLIENGDYNNIVEGFEGKIKPLLKENERKTVLLSLILLIKEDTTINSDTVVDIISATRKCDLDYNICDYSKTLAGIFLYILNNTNNEQEKGYAVEIAEKYIDKSRMIQHEEVEDMLRNKKEETSVAAIRLFDGNLFTPEGLSIICGKWDEKNRRDIELIEELTGTNYIDFRESIRVGNNLIIDISDGNVTIENACEYRRQMIEEIDELHFKSLLDSLKNTLFKSSIFSRNYNDCLEGIVDFFAQLSSNSKQRKRLKHTELHNCFYLFENDIFGGKSEYAIKNLIRVADVLLEADIKTFVTVIDDQIKTENSKLYELVSNSDSQVIYSLADAIGKASMHEKYFPDVLLLFYELSKHNQLFEQYMNFIMNPEYSPCNIGVDMQVGVIKKLYNQDSNWTWNFVAGLLPGNYPDRLLIWEYRYLPIYIGEKSKEKSKRLVKFFINFLCDNTDRSTEQLKKLILVLPYVDNEIVSEIVEVITKESTQDKNEILWGILQKVTKRIPDSNEEKQKMIDVLRSHFLSGKEDYTRKELFSYRNLSNNIKEIKTAAKENIQELYESEGIEGIASFAVTVENSFLLADITMQIMPKEQLIELIDNLSDGKYNRFRALLVGNLSSKELIEYIEKDIRKRIHLVSEHIIDDSIIAYGEKLKKPERIMFWENVYTGGSDSLSKKNYAKLIKQLRKQHRCEDAICSLAYCLDKKEIDIDLIFETLNEYDIPAESDTKKKIETEINDLIGYLQKNAFARRDEIAEIEKKYIHELVPLGIVSPKCIFYKMANEPDYVKKMLEDEYEQNQNGYYSSIIPTLFYHCNIAPGIQEDGTFDYLIFKKWINYVDSLSDSSIKEKMQSLFAKMIIFTPKDTDGFIMNRNVADYIEGSKNRKLLINIEVALINCVGAINVTPGSNEEDEVISRFKKSSKSFMDEGYYEIAKIYRNVADIFEDHYSEESF